VSNIKNQKSNKHKGISKESGYLLLEPLCPGRACPTLAQQITIVIRHIQRGLFAYWIMFI